MILFASDRQRLGGNALVLVLALSVAFAAGVFCLLAQSHAQARSARVELRSVEALYEAYGELEKASLVIRRIGNDEYGQNRVIRESLTQPGRVIPGTNVVVSEMTGSDGTWYELTAKVPYEDRYEHIVSQPVRETDFFSSYLLFVSEDPAGISGEPIGAIHSNESVEFYFPNGPYRHAVTAVGGFQYKGGATAENTELSGPFDPEADRVDLDLDGQATTNLVTLEANSEDRFRFPATEDLKLRFYIEDGGQWVNIERWTPGTLVSEVVDKIVGYTRTNERTEPYTYKEKVSQGFTTRSKEVDVLDHYETVDVTEKVPVYADEVRTVSKPVYKYIEKVIEVPVYKDEVRTRTVVKDVWVSLGLDGGSGTTLGGTLNALKLGYWTKKEVEEQYTVKVQSGVESKKTTERVIDHYEDVQETVKKLTGYEDVVKQVQKAVYRKETQTWEEEVFVEEERSGTRTVWDEEPIYESVTRQRPVEPQLIESRDELVPDEAIFFSEGDVKALEGDILGRVTVASEGTIDITGNLVYRDAEGDSAYQNGLDPDAPYESNPDYSGDAALGIVARHDVLYTRSVPDNLEVNASIAAIEGRVGLEGVVLDENGEVVSYNQFVDEYGRPEADTFARNSIRRLGGVTTARRPVETVLAGDSVAAGFNVGKAVYDPGLLSSPPPSFLSIPEPRFFPKRIVK